MAFFDRQQPKTRRRLTLAVDRLEGRALLTASAVSQVTHIEAVLTALHEARVEHVAAVKAARVEHVAAVKAARVAHIAAVREARAERRAGTVIPRSLVDMDPVTANPDGSDPTTDGSDPINYTPSVQATTPIAGYFNPTQIQTAYSVNQLSIGNQGAGQTIGIVDEFNDPNIIADANVFSAQYGLPQFNTTGGPTMSVVEDTTFGSVPNSATSGGNDVSGETSIDVEWAHAMAPKANIILVEVPATGSNANAFAELLHGVQLAAQDGASAVSLSYGLSEGSIGAANVVSLDATYLAPGTAASGVAVTVSTGDGSTPLFPASSPNVIGVGGTSLYTNSSRGKYGYETAWGGLAGAGAGGGGLSTNFAAPTFQSSHGVTFAKRALPDVSLVADPVTGVSVYDSWDAGTAGGWTAYGGTSVASPIFGGILADAQAARVNAGKSILTSVQINNAMYSLYNSSAYSTYFHDVTLGKNANVSNSGRTTVTGFSATTGYDEATGLGSPIASTLVPYLAGL